MVVGNPATIAAARNSVAPAPGARTFPTEMSSTKAGSMPEVLITPWKIPARRSPAWVSLNNPRPPLVKAVRRAQVTTIWLG